MGRVKKACVKANSLLVSLCYQLHCRALQHTLHLFKGPVSHASVEKSPKEHSLQPHYPTTTTHPAPSTHRPPSIQSLCSLALLGLLSFEPLWYLLLKFVGLAELIEEEFNLRCSIF